MSEGPKYQKLADIIRNNIEDGLYTDGHVLDTEYELANKYGMSRQTVRQALGLLENEGIVERIRGSGTYVKQKRVAHKKTMTIGVIVPNVSEYIFPTVIKGIEGELAQHGYHMKLSATLNLVEIERNILIDYLKNPVDGLIVQGVKTNLPNPNISLYQEISKKGIPYVFCFAHYPELKDAVYVITDNRSGGKQAVCYLANKGHRYIASILKINDLTSVERYKGYLEGLIEEKLSIDEKKMIWFATESQDVKLEGEFGLRLLKALEKCTALLCHNDFLAIRVIEFLKKAGKRIPDDIAIVGCDNSTYGDLNSIKITSLNYPKEEGARIAAKQIIRMINGGHGERITLPMEIVEKGST